MYEFPSPTWYMTGWWPTVYHLVVLAGGLSAMGWIVRRARVPQVYDAASIGWLAMGVTILFLFPIGEPWEERQTANAWFFQSIWGTALLVTLYSWSKAEIFERQQLVRRSLGTFVLCLFFSLPLLSPIIIAILRLDAKEAARKTQCLNNMRQVGLAIYNTAQDSRGYLPMASSGSPPHSWRVDILPQLYSTSLYSRYDMSKEWNERGNEEIAREELEVFRCPSNPYRFSTENFPLTAFVAVVGEQTMWPNSRAMSLDDVVNADGYTQTAMIVEACGARIPWAEPRDMVLGENEVGFNLPGEHPNQSQGIFSSYHPVGANVIFGDNSGKHLSNKTDPKILRAILTATGGEKISSEDF